MTVAHPCGNLTNSPKTQSGTISPRESFSLQKTAARRQARSGSSSTIFSSGPTSLLENPRLSTGSPCVAAIRVDWFRQSFSSGRLRGRERSVGNFCGSTAMPRGHDCELCMSDSDSGTTATGRSGHTMCLDMNTPSFRGYPLNTIHGKNLRGRPELQSFYAYFIERL
jgi:hypothetical protein